MTDEADAAVDYHIWGKFDRALREGDTRALPARHRAMELRPTELPAGQRALELKPRPEDQR